MEERKLEYKVFGRRSQDESLVGHTTHTTHTTQGSKAPNGMIEDSTYFFVR